jgi:2,3-diaminopropionate biosynthesis protein SbnA
MISSVETRTARAVIRIDDDETEQISEPVAIRRACPSTRADGEGYLLHHIFEAQADARPEAVAVVFGREETTYAELERRANRLARHLRACGVWPKSLVAMLLPRSIDAYATVLGILKAGAAYVPLDADYPPDRLSYILENSGATALVTTGDLARHAAFDGAVIRLDTDRAKIDAQSGARLPREMATVAPRDLCYVIYTSGATGRPKGVMIEHRSVHHLVCAERHIYGVRPEDRVFQGASLCFDRSVEEIWMAFHAGATLIAATPEIAHAGPDLSRFLTDYGVTVLSCAPTLVSMLAEDVPMLRLLILGGETCPERLVERWARPGRRLLNTYGPTEATVIATYAELVPAKPVTIGRAIPGYRAYLLDDGLHAVQPGETGEIWIGGAGVARGYMGLPGHTGARFLADPFAPDRETKERMYRTGDLGRLDGDGNLQFLGRADSQVKLGGFRLELAEIESVLMQGEGVRAAACALREDVAGVQQLVGYVVPSNGAVDKDRLRSHLRNRLPSYMVPAFIETITDLPRLPSGKLDRASLPAPRERETTSKRADVGTYRTRSITAAPRPTSRLVTRLEQLRKMLRPTPNAPLVMPGMNLFAKLEYVNPIGSIKDRAAYWILTRAAERGEICEKTTVIESSSGNFAAALAAFTQMVGLRFIPVIDPNISAACESFLRRMCPTVVKVEERDDIGGFLKTRLEKVKELCATMPNAYWTNQYENLDAMEAHYELTAAEICADFESLNYVFIGVSTAGTIAGVSRRLKERYPNIRVIAVDTEGSAIFGGAPRKRYIPGIGSSIVPPLLSYAKIDDIVWISERETVEACQELLTNHGLFVGGSSGTAFAAVKKYAARMPAHTQPNVLFLCADRGTPYLDTVFDATWVTRLE